MITPSTKDLVSLLQDPGTYPERPHHVETIETHISWVFLAGGYAYKLKKPVHFEFLDFSTPEARRSACTNELNLNRRMAHDVYLSVLPITIDEQSGLALDGAGREIDYLVKMRRLVSELSLAQKILEHRLPPTEIDAVARYLVEAFARLTPQTVQAEDHYGQIVKHCRQNSVDLLAHLDASHRSLILRVHGNQLRYLFLQESHICDRVRDGRVVDGHGDLRAEHIYVEATPQVIDCIEFSDELREADVADELCFLAMDCQRLGNSQVGDRVLAKYAEVSGDHPPDSLLGFYKSYRACVRAKVSALRAEQATDAEKKPHLREVHQYLAWADHYASGLGSPVLVVVGGPMGSGKSTLAKALAEKIGAEHIQTDALRQLLFGPSSTPARFGADHYAPRARRLIYEKLFSKSEEYLDEGLSVVLDGTFLTNDLRRTAENIGRRHCAMPLLVNCQCARETSLSRIGRRAAKADDDSEARPELYDRQVREFEPMDPALSAMVVNTESSLGEELRAISRSIHPCIH